MKQHHSLSSVTVSLHRKLNSIFLDRLQLDIAEQIHCIRLSQMEKCQGSETVSSQMFYSLYIWATKHVMSGTLLSSNIYIMSLYKHLLLLYNQQLFTHRCRR